MMSFCESNDKQLEIDHQNNGDCSIDSCPLTPPRSRHCSGVNNMEPLTPLANLKILLTAASPEIRNRTFSSVNESGHLLSDTIATDVTSESSFVEKIENVDINYECVEEEVTESFMHRASGEKFCSGNRKEKSLGLLCERFLALFPQYVDPSLEGLSMCLDEIANELGVERRRVYDIVNILESLQLVSRVAKNSYVWHGRNNLSQTLSQLKAMAQTNRMAEQLDISESQDEMYGLSEDGVKKEKSLGIMCQKFLMLLMVSQDGVLNLEQSARVLIGCSEEDSFESSKYKTKIRRLYDIANVLSSLNLIKKVQFPECKGKRPVFQYTGPELKLSLLTDASSSLVRRPSTKHSMLSPGPLQDDQNNTVRLKVVNAPSFKRFSSFQQTATQSQKKAFCRHASLEQICAVVEQERSKLYSHSRSADKENIDHQEPSLHNKSAEVKITPNTFRGHKSGEVGSGKVSRSAETSTSRSSPIVMALTKSQLETMLKNMKSPNDSTYLIKMNSVLKNSAPKFKSSTPDFDRDTLAKNYSAERTVRLEFAEEPQYDQTTRVSDERRKTPNQPILTANQQFVLKAAPLSTNSAFRNLSQNQIAAFSQTTNSARKYAFVNQTAYSNLSQPTADMMCLEDFISPVFTMTQRKRPSAGLPTNELPPSLISVLPPTMKRPALSVIGNCHERSDTEWNNGLEADGVISASVARRLPLFD